MTTLLQLGVYITHTHTYTSTWIFENQVPLRKRLGVYFSLFFVVQKPCLKFTKLKQNTTASLSFFLSLSLPSAFFFLDCVFVPFGVFKSVEIAKIFISLS